jgi:hypothetical protein
MQKRAGVEASVKTPPQKEKPMLFMNEYEINDAVDQFRNHPVLSKATRFLAKFRDEVKHPEQATEQSLKAAISPIKAFYTRRGTKAGMRFPEGILEEPPAPQAPHPLPKHIWEITVQVRDGDWHYTRTSEPVPFDVAVHWALEFEQGFLIQGGRLVSIANVDPPQT